MSVSVSGAGAGRIALRIPQAAVTMTEGTIVEWEVADGETVTEGQVLYRLETEKVELEVESPAAGVFHPTVRVGETHPVGAEVGFVETG